VRVGPSGSLILRGELDIATIDDLQARLDEIMVPGEPVVLDLAQLTFLDSAAVHCLVRTWTATGHPVVLRNTSPTVRRILELADEKAEPDAWAFDGDKTISPPESI
jgi:anti-anti-sigma factor